MQRNCCCITLPGSLEVFLSSCSKAISDAATSVGSFATSSAPRRHNGSPKELQV